MEGPNAVVIKVKLGEEDIEIPTKAVKILSVALEDIAKGKRLSVFPERTELTIQQAADILQVSRPFLVALLKAGKIPFHKVGIQRRVSLQDIEDYKIQKKKRRQPLDELTRISQDLNLY